MRIGVIGCGNIGSALAKRLVPQGHEVMLSFSRDEASLKATADALGAYFGTAVEAAAFGEVIALTVPWGVVNDALAQVGSLDGKIVWDCTNPLLPDMSGLAIGTTTSGGETIAALVPGAKVVKSIPPFAELLHSDDPLVGGRPVGVFVAGDDAVAKAAVTSLLEALPAAVTDAGDLTASRFVEPAMMLLVNLAYKQGLGPRIALDLIK